MRLTIGVLSAVLVVAGLIIAGFGLRMALTPAIPAEFAATTAATVGSFESSYQSKAGGRTIRIHYEVNGRRYNESMPLLNDSWRVGDRLEIRYDTRNPASKEWMNASPTGA